MNILKLHPLITKSDILKEINYKEFKNIIFKSGFLKNPDWRVVNAEYYVSIVNDVEDVIKNKCAELKGYIDEFLPYPFDSIADALAMVEEIKQDYSVFDTDNILHSHVTDDK